MPSRNGVGCTLDKWRRLLADLARQSAAIERVEHGELQQGLIFGVGTDNTLIAFSRSNPGKLNRLNHIEEAFGLLFRLRGMPWSA